MYVGRCLTLSNVLPTYKPTMPKTDIIVPDKKLISNAKLAQPSAFTSPKK